MKSECCNAELIQRTENGKPVLSLRLNERLLNCEKCGMKYQCRDGRYGHPYQTKKKSKVETKSEFLTGRVTLNDKKRIIKLYGSMQKAIDSLGNVTHQQYKQ